MFRYLAVSAFTTASLLAIAPAFAQDQATSPTTAQQTATPAAAPNPTVGGAEMFPEKTIVENASTASTLTTLVTAVKAADLATTLSGPGPFTVFAPTNDAFARLSPGALDTLLKPENKALLVKVLTYHVVPGIIDAEALLKQTQAGSGTTTLMTVEGEPITVTLEKVDGNDALVLADVKGNKSYVTQYNVKQSNGIVHTVNGVLLPTQKTDAATPPTDGDATGADTPATGERPEPIEKPETGE